MASQTESAQLVESCVKLFQALSADSSFGQLQTLVVENERLRTKTSGLQTAYDVNLQTLTGLQSEVAVERGRTTAKASQLAATNNTVAELKKNIEEIEATLKDKEKRLNVSAELMTKMQGDFKKNERETQQLKKTLKDVQSEIEKAKQDEREARQQLNAAQAELDKREARLRKLDSFAVKLEPEPSVATLNQLGAIFKDSFSLMRNYLGVDLANDVLSDSSMWDKIRNNMAVKRAIPVPSTNSSDAKKMRVAASLAILAFALEEHVFQPTYLLGDNELPKLLYELSTSDFEKEAHLRSVLLTLSPSKHKAHASERAKKASNCLLSYMSPLLPASKQNGFASALEKICQDASHCWGRVQRLADRVELIMSYDIVPDKDTWKLMEFPGMDGQPSKAQGAPPPGGKKNGAKPKTEASGSSSGAVENFEAVVWPTFVLFDENDAQETLHEGLALNKLQVKDAQEEEKLGFRAGHRRMTRQDSRRQSIQNGTDAATKKDFLSAGAGGSSGGN
ncbi:uncharacterized protein LY79DRAFT_197401 [Colletotrichum navitas]|uniref:MEI5 protein n=1 Tax=Colletotrichum navitas TaxID=681940 RepID=A0AAD8PZR0_9PEZI|nr:uncharacterized protein LY79DRAFT_197401 [Colletotrichum navitas]KAK1590692.1 hypothetical protein LY79DRAFT_197401 [Colletotrichum navitas]